MIPSAQLVDHNQAPSAICNTVDRVHEFRRFQLVVVGQLEQCQVAHMCHGRSGDIRMVIGTPGVWWEQRAHGEDQPGIDGASAEDAEMSSQLSDDLRGY